MHLHTFACSVTDLKNSGILPTHKNKGKILIHITSVEKISGTRLLISHVPFRFTATTKRACFFTAGIVLHQTICR